MYQSAVRPIGSQTAQPIQKQTYVTGRVGPNIHVQFGRPLEPLRARTKACRQPANFRRHSATCAAVVDSPLETGLQSAGLGWPRGFHNRYLLREQFGKGSFGTVYLATEKLTGQEVAAKIIPKERKGTTTEHIISKIQQEVLLLSTAYLAFIDMLPPQSTRQYQNC